jgi:hypothetical protein
MLGFFFVTFCFYDLFLTTHNLVTFDHKFFESEKYFPQKFVIKKWLEASVKKKLIKKNK